MSFRLTAPTMRARPPGNDFDTFTPEKNVEHELAADTCHAPKFRLGRETIEKR